MSDSKKSDVGYCKPPVAHQFPKGRSGNPSGRPRGKSKVINPKALLLEVLAQDVVANINGKRTKIPKIKALFHQLMNKAMQGDLRAIQAIVKLNLTLPDVSIEPIPMIWTLDEESEKKVEEIIKRLQASV